MAFKAINDLAGPNGLIPTLLVYGAYLRMLEHETPTATIAQRALAVKKAMAEIQKLRAKRQVADALNTRNGPTTTSTLDLLLNSQVLVQRKGNTGQTGSWNGLYRLVSTDNESCVVALPYGDTTFRSTVVKPFLTPVTNVEGINLLPTDAPTPVDTLEDTAEIALIDRTIAQTQPTAKRGRGRLRKYLVDAADISVYLQEDAADFNGCLLVH